MQAGIVGGTRADAERVPSESALATRHSSYSFFDRLKSAIADSHTIRKFEMPIQLLNATCILFGSHQNPRTTCFDVPLFYLLPLTGTNVQMQELL
jgi:hypothetical protein